MRYQGITIASTANAPAVYIAGAGHVGSTDHVLLCSIAITFASPASGVVEVRHTRNGVTAVLSSTTLSAAADLHDFYTAPYALMNGDQLSIDTSDTNLPATCFVTIGRWS